MALDWAAIETALVTWVRTASGVTTILAKQKAPQPALPYCTVAIIDGPRKFSGVDPVDMVTNLGNPLGQEIEMTVRAEREITVSVQAFTAGAIGAAPARDLLHKASVALVLPSGHDTLFAAGLTVIEAADIQALDAVMETAFEGRASMDVRMYLKDLAVEKTGYIATVTGPAGTYT